MFSDHLPKIERASNRHLWLLAAALVIVCQLIAMALVAREQVSKAELRRALSASVRVAVVRCLESAASATLNSCLLQAHAQETAPAEDYSGTTVARGDGTDSQAQAVHTTALSLIQGLMPVSFAPN